jgi:alanine dehydrogenase
MRDVIGIRRESVDATERRAPLTPEQVSLLVREYDIEVVVQPSRLRIFPDEDYEAAGAVVADDLSRCNIILGLKEVPIERIKPKQVYCFFSHTIKAQRYNMPMLRNIIESGCTLLDYELVTNDIGKRLISFGEFAGYAAMVDSLWALGQRLESEGIASPFANIQQTAAYPTLSQAREAVEEAGQLIRNEGLPKEITPFVCAFTGRGHVSKGAQKIFNLLPSVEVRPEDLQSLTLPGAYSGNAAYRVEFRKPDLYEPFDNEARFDPEEFEAKPGRYREKFHRYIDYLTVMINGIFWSPRYPRLLSREHVRELYARQPKPRLRLITDVACDIEGSIEMTVRHTTSDSPVYVYEPVTGRVITGHAGQGPVVMAVDKLPAELPRESSDSFGESLLPFLPELARADFSKPIDELKIPEPFKKAVIVHRGSLTQHFRYLNEYLL